MITEIERLHGAYLCDTEEDIKECLSEWGNSPWGLTKSEIEMIISGKTLVLDDGEYTNTVYLRKEITE